MFKETAAYARNWTPSAGMKVGNLNHCTNQAWTHGREQTT